ncbi:hypothetical protein ABQJ54_02040 [Rhodanobacter sp. Si-c]|uniref:Uncharacterized protein n=1 Tax=Rhodanobacter lycopersici TaxID=3162487 RepID=A0ABV3Q9M8_9GAMM
MAANEMADANASVSSLDMVSPYSCREIIPQTCACDYLLSDFTYVG